MMTNDDVEDDYNDDEDENDDNEDNDDVEDDDDNDKDDHIHNDDTDNDNEQWILGNIYSNFMILLVFGIIDSYDTFPYDE